MSGYRRYSPAVEAARVSRERARAAAWEAQRRETERRAHERWQRQQYLFSRQQQAEQLNADLAQRMSELDGVLRAALAWPSWALDFESLKSPPELLEFDPQGADRPAAAPLLESFLPPQPGFLQRLFPGASERHQRAVDEAHRQYHVRLGEHAAYERARQAWLEEAVRRHEEVCRQRQREADQHNAQVDNLRAEYLANDREAVIECLLQAFTQEDLPTGFPRQVLITFDPDERLLVVERELPAADIIPQIASYRWYKTRDQIEESPRSQAQIKALYTTLVANMALRSLHIAFSADATRCVDTVVLNCFVDVINPATGKPDKPYLLTVRVRKEDFAELDLNNVQPVLCLKRLRALVSRSPHELEPVEPILSFNMVDARFVEGQPVLDTLDQRKNIATLTPYEFEALIRDLFERMGHDTKQTRPSRDGGVDCVAFDKRPILGGKVVIQAKRYRHVVGVAAVRDLYGTVQNERATKGILIATSHYTSAARDFAKDLPLQLIDGAGLLSLLETEAGVEAKIEFPEGWSDPAGAARGD